MTKKKKTTISVPLLFLILFSIEDCTAWTSSPTPTKHLSTRRGRRRPRSSRKHRLVDTRLTRADGCTRRSCARQLLVHVKNDDDDDIDVVEEEFYSEYENMYSQAKSTNNKSENSKDALDQDKEKQDDPPTGTTSKNRKVEVAKAWDEALLERSAGTPDTTDANSNGGSSISNLSDLQLRLQQIQKRNKEGPLQDYSLEQLDNETELWEDSNLDAPKRTVAKDNVMTNEQYLEILNKAQERLLKLADSESNPLAFQKREKKTLISNMSSLQERLNQIQKDASEEESFDTPLDEPPKAKLLDDDTLTEWENLDNQLREEAAANRQSSPPSSLKETPQDDFLPDEAAILDALRSQAANNRLDKDSVDDETIESSTINGRDESLDPNAIPSEYKKIVSNYELTEDGGVFLSPEAYQEACNNANPDGSLNFGSIDSPSSLESAIFDDEPPMAPYGSSAASGTQLSIQDLTQEASRNLEFARNHPEAQEELHRRLMAEFEAEEPTNDEFENELLLDPEKAIAFWNQEYIEEQKVESDALEDLLDQKMRELEMEEQGNEPGNSDSRQGPLGRRIEAPKQRLKGDENIFFASRQERIDRKRNIERDLRTRAKNIAKFYKESSQDNSWDDTSESKEVEEITRRQAARTEMADSKLDDKSNDKIQEHGQETTDDVLSEALQQTKDEKEWILVEDPESPEDAFYWNEATGEMRWDPPDE